MSISTPQLKAIMPNGARVSPDPTFDQWRDALNTGMQQFAVTTNLRVAAFLAQIAVESGELLHLEENLNYSADALMRVFPKEFPTATLANQYARQPHKIADRVYADRLGNGDEASGDGWTYRGRGLIQLTGRVNYLECGKDIGDLSLGLCPDRLLTKLGAAQSAAWFFAFHGCNELADAGNIDAISHRINGGSEEIVQRRTFYAQALKVLNAG